MENQGRQRGAIGLVEGKRERRKEQNSIKEEKKKGDSLTRVRSLSQRCDEPPRARSGQCNATSPA